MKFLVFSLTTGEIKCVIEAVTPQDVLANVYEGRGCLLLSPHSGRIDGGLVRIVDDHFAPRPGVDEIPDEYAGWIVGRVDLEADTEEPLVAPLLEGPSS